MHLPDHFHESRADVLREFVVRHPLATLVANASSGLTANLLPMIWSVADRENSAGVLRGHIARANGLWRQVSAGDPVLVVFNGANHYVSPNWYPSKHSDTRVVPTWNYATVQLHGRIRFVEDRAWLHALVSELTRTHEQSQAVPWQVTDAPADYLDGMLRAIVGIEIEVTRVEGKFKGSQNRTSLDRAAVATHLRAEGLDEATVAELVPDTGSKA